MIPRGIQPGFDTNPGAVWLDTRAAWERMTPDLTPERRATEHGLIEGLRLRRLTDGRETLIMTDAQSQPVSYRTADPGRPDMISLDGLAMPERPGLLHSHITDASLSADDLAVLFQSGGHAITAISPGGSIWRATRVPGALLRPALAATGSLPREFATELRANEHGAEVFAHARLLYLERQGVITYSWHMSERVRQIMDANADLIRRLSDGEL